MKEACRHEILYVEPNQTTGKFEMRCKRVSFFLDYVFVGLKMLLALFEKLLKG